MIRVKATSKELSTGLYNNSASVSYLLLSGIEGEIPNVQSVALLQQLLLIIAVTLKTQTTISTTQEVKDTGFFTVAYSGKVTLNRYPAATAAAETVRYADFMMVKRGRNHEVFKCKVTKSINTKARDANGC